jgi:hypothetical protein
MKNDGKNINGKNRNNMNKNKIKKGGKNGKAKAPKFTSISEGFYNGLVEQCMINGVSITVIKKIRENQK